jgi:hypothetical protein
LTTLATVAGSLFAKSRTWSIGVGSRCVSGDGSAAAGAAPAGSGGGRGALATALSAGRRTPKTTISVSSRNSAALPTSLASAIASGCCHSGG